MKSTIRLVLQMSVIIAVLGLLSTPRPTAAQGVRNVLPVEIVPMGRPGWLFAPVAWAVRLVLDPLLQTPEPAQTGRVVAAPSGWP